MPRRTSWQVPSSLCGQSAKQGRRSDRNDLPIDNRYLCICTRAGRSGAARSGGTAFCGVTCVSATGPSWAYQVGPPRPPRQNPVLASIGEWLRTPCKCIHGGRFSCKPVAEDCAGVLWDVRCVHTPGYIAWRHQRASMVWTCLRLRLAGKLALFMLRVLSCNVLHV